MKIITDIAYAELPSPFGLADLYLPDSPGPKPRLVLSIHGGWSSLDRHSFSGVARFLCENGFAVFNTEYRLTKTATWPACGNDCLKASGFLLDPEAIPDLRMIRDRRLVVVGASSGGHLVLMTGLRMLVGTCRAIISISGVADHSGFIPRSPGCYHSFFGHNPGVCTPAMSMNSGAGAIRKNGKVPSMQKHGKNN